MTDLSHKNIRSRFAPSPTGYVHIGSLRTALFAYLFAKNKNGTAVVRVEDTDQARMVAGAIENMISVMATLGVVFDEGPIVINGKLTEQGSFGPYTQSNRLPIYEKHVQQLIDEKKAYYCFCSSERLDEIRKEQIALKRPPMYDRHCRNLSDTDVTAQMNSFEHENKQPVVRMKIPEVGSTTVHDLVFGDIVYDNSVLDDQVLLKSDGFPTYHLAVVVDDHLMQITHVIRGDDWLPSTPKHILLYEAFGWEAPSFAHLPLILNPDKTKLSKRQGDVAVEDYLAKGYLPEALVNFVALLGWNPKTEQEIFNMEELIAQFDLAKVNKAGAVMDVSKLEWMNSQYIKAASITELVKLCKPYWKQAGIAIEEYSHKYLEAIVELEQDRLKKLADISEHQFYFTAPIPDPIKLVWKKSTAAETKQKLSDLAEFFERLPEEQYEKQELESALKEYIIENGFDNGSVLWPLRVALTGLEKSPGPFEVAATLFIGHGIKEIVQRLRFAADAFQ